MNKSSILKDLFTILNVDENDGTIQAEVAINKDSDIYKAHFPGDPITPGVCQMHLIKDVLSSAYPNKNFKLKNSKQTKFTEVLRPTEHTQIQVNIQVNEKDEQFHINAQVYNAEKVFLKAKLTYSCGA